MIRQLKRALNPSAMNYQAGRQARYMGMFADGDPAKIAGAMKNKGEIYDIDRFPDQSIAAQARNDFEGYRMDTPAMRQIGADMQRFYGFQTAGVPTRTSALEGAMPLLSTGDKRIAQELISEAQQQPAQALYQSASARTGPPAQHPVSLEEGIAIANRRGNAYSEPIGPDPQQQAANDLKDDYVNHTLGYDVKKEMQDIASDYDQTVAAQRQVDDTQRMIDDRIKELEDGQWMTGSQTGDMALLGGSALLAGGGIGRMMGTDEDDRMEEARRNGYILN